MTEGRGKFIALCVLGSAGKPSFIANTLFSCARVIIIKPIDTMNSYKADPWPSDKGQTQ